MTNFIMVLCLTVILLLVAIAAFDEPFLASSPRPVVHTEKHGDVTITTAELPRRWPFTLFPAKKDEDHK